MTTRRRTTWVFQGILGASAWAGAVATFAGCGASPPTDAPTVATRPAAKAPLEMIAEGIARSDEASLAAVVNQLAETVDGKPRPIPDDEAHAWVAVVSSIRRGFLGFEGANGRENAVAAISKILDRFGVDPAPSPWVETLDPARDLWIAALADPSPAVRSMALGSITKVWHWYPGRTMLPVEETRLGEWKDKLHPEVLRKLADKDPHTRASAVICLSFIPIDALAAPAIAYLDDPQSGEVRHQVLASFSARRSLLTEDMIIKRLHDPEPGVPQTAELILKTRGLTADQITLGRLITSSKPELRASVIPLIKGRDDLDPVVWLLRLSHDADEMVRTKAAEAMTGRTAPEIRARLREMASKDTSAAVRAVAGKLVAASLGSETTVALPPLPGSPSLTPRAN